MSQFMQNDFENSIAHIRQTSDIFEKAKQLNDLLKNNNLRLVDLAKKLAMKPSYVCHFLRLNRLPEIVVDGYYSSLISQSHLFIISRLKDPTAIVAAYEKILTDNLTVAQTDELVRQMLHGIKTEGEYLSSQERDKLIETFKQNNDTIKAKIIQTRIKGKFIFEVKGSPQDTTRTLKKLIERLNATSWEKDS